VPSHFRCHAALQIASKHRLLIGCNGTMNVPTGDSALKKYWARYLDLLDNDLNTRIFDSFKNMVLCALLFAAGTNAVQTDHRVFLSLTALNLAGWGIIAVSAALMVLNMSDGIRRLGKLRYHLVLQILIIVIYLVISERVVEIVWSFRAT
jgi:hypothetical protein